MHLPNRFLAALGLAFFAACAPASAAMNKCTGADGKVTFTEKACETDQQQTSLPQRGVATPSGAAPGAAKPPVRRPGDGARQPFVRDSERCRQLETILKQAYAQAPSGIDSQAAQQRDSYGRAYAKECVDDQALDRYGRDEAPRQAAEHCVGLRKRVEESRRLLARNPHPPEATLRAILEDEKSLFLLCRP